jgi:hypothetical protein
VRILGLNHAPYHVDQRIHPRLLLQTADGTRRQAVLNAGLLLGVKEEGMVQQQTQGQAAAGPLFIALRGQLPPSFMSLPVLKEHLDQPSQGIRGRNIHRPPTQVTGHSIPILLLTGRLERTTNRFCSWAQTYSRALPSITVTA